MQRSGCLKAVNQMLEKEFAGKSVLVTGGMGFIGSNLAIRLAEAGAKVTILDAMIPDYGGNEFNITPVAESLARQLL